MDKAEMKRKFIERWTTRHWKPTAIIKFSSELDEYAQQVSREVAIEFVKWLTQHGHNLTDHLGMYSVRFDDWQNQQ